MDDEELVVRALTEGASASRRGAASASVASAYEDLRRLVAAALPPGRRGLIRVAESGGLSARVLLAAELRGAGAGAAEGVLAAARRLRNLLGSPGSGEEGNRQQGLVGLEAGPADSQRAPESSRRPPLRSGAPVAWDGSERLASGKAGYPAQPAPGRPMTGDVPVGQARRRARPTSGQPDAANGQEYAPPVYSLRRTRPGWLPSPEEAGGPARVILIEHSSGVQVGSGNDQISTYRVTLPHSSLGSADSLARTLLSPDAPWSGDLFSHDARADLTRSAGSGGGSSSGGIIEGPRGDTLVIVRNSRGVQVGNGNTQINDFRLRVSDVSVRATGVGLTSRREGLVSRLRQNPGDAAAARQLADDIGQAARADLEADLTVQVTRTVGAPQITARSGEFSGLTGRQVGGPGNRATVRVKVTVGKFDTAALARRFQAAAARLTRPGHHSVTLGHPGDDSPRTLSTPGRDYPGTQEPGGGSSRTLSPGRPGSGIDPPPASRSKMWPRNPGPSRPGREGPGGRLLS
jgi:hypothetical protein